MCTLLKLLAGVLVLVDCAKDGNDFLLCRERYGTLMIGGHCFFSFNASGCFIVSLLKNRKTIFPGVKKADAITAASSEGARETHPVRQSDLFRPVLNRTYSAEIPRLKGRPPSASSHISRLCFGHTCPTSHNHA